MSAPVANAPRPPRRWLRRGAYAVVFLAILAAVPFSASLYQEWKINRDLAAAVAETDRLDPGWRFEDLEAAYEGAPDAENAALLLARLGQRFPDGYMPIFTAMPIPEGMEAGTAEHRMWLLDIESSLDDLTGVYQLNEQQIMGLNSEWKEHREAFEEARKLASYTKCRLPIGTKESAASYNSTRVAMRLLNLDAMRLLQAKELNTALDCQRALLTLAGFQQAYPGDLCQLMRAATIDVTCKCVNRTLGQGTPDRGRLAEIQAALAKAEAAPVLLSHARVERALHWQSHQQLLRDSPEDQKKTMEAVRKIERAVEGKQEEVPWYRSWLAKDMKYDARVYATRELRGYSAWVEFANKPLANQYREFDQFARQQREVQGLLSRSFEKLVETHWRIQMRLRTTRTAIALERYRQTKGDWPQSLDQLVPEFIDSVPIDLYAGKPLLYRRVEHGAVVYSVGPDEKDNGGRLRANKDEVVDLRLNGLDIGVRLWDPAHRRQPALPPVAPPHKSEF